jgi:hypothetical protein
MKRYKKSKFWFLSNDGTKKELASLNQGEFDELIKSVDEFGGAWTRTGSIVADSLGSIMDVMNDYYENEESLDTKPIVRLTIDISQLDFNLFDVDDDYKLNQYKWNKSQGTEDELIESLDIWGAISYKGTIPPDLIKDITFDYGN